MKNALFFLAIALTLATARPARAADQYFKATVTGTVQTQIILGLGEGRIRIAPMNNQRIFQEFCVSPQDYELVFSLNDVQLQLVAKHAAANLPKITILGAGTAGALIDTTTRAEKFQSDIIAGSATNLFKDIAGELAGTIFYHGSLANGVVTKFVFSVTARGTDPVGGNTPFALLKFKVATQGEFVPQ